MTHLVLLVPILLPGLGIVLPAPCDVRILGGQAERVEGRPAHADGRAHVQWDKLESTSSH